MEAVRDDRRLHDRAVRVEPPVDGPVHEPVAKGLESVRGVVVTGVCVRISAVRNRGGSVSSRLMIMRSSGVQRMI
jgi:hypothetical protein